MPEREHNPEAQLEQLRKSVDAVIALALQTIRERFDEAPDIRNRLPYHNTDHTEGVIRRTETILRALRDVSPERVSERDIQIGRLAGGFHDTVHIRSVPGQNVGVSERASAEEAIAFMREQNTQLGYDVFSADDEQRVNEAIDGTVPAFETKLGTTTQPNVREVSSIITRALALADLGIAGMEGPENYNQTSDALFREGNLDILDALNSGQPIPDNIQEQFRQRMVAWMTRSAGFAVGRKAMFDTELAVFTPAEQEVLHDLFRHFDETIASIDVVLQRRQSMTFQELAQDMGYT